MKQITLTLGYTAIVDDEDFEAINQFRWYAQPNSIGSMYACRWTYDEDGKHVRRWMHRVIANAPDDMLVDHRDQHTLDNRRANLRLATRSQNQHNRAINANNTSGFKGVHYRKDAGKFAATIYLNGRPRYLGLHVSAESAYEAYCEAAIRLHGEFARLK